MSEMLEKLEIDFFYLKQLWQEYKKLFSNEESIEEINKYFGQCFQVIQLAMNNEIIITINRLLDKEKTGTNNKNLVLENLKHYLKDTSKEIFERKLNQTREVRKCCKLKEMRDKRLAHRDIKQGDSFLLINYDCIEKLINEIEDMFKFFREENNLEYVEYSEFVTPPGCENLIEVIKIFNKNHLEK